MLFNDLYNLDRLSNSIYNHSCNNIRNIYTATTCQALAEQDTTQGTTPTVSHTTAIHENNSSDKCRLHPTQSMISKHVCPLCRPNAIVLGLRQQDIIEIRDGTPKYVFLYSIENGNPYFYKPQSDTDITTSTTTDSSTVTGGSTSRICNNTRVVRNIAGRLLIYWLCDICLFV